VTELPAWLTEAPARPEGAAGRPGAARAVRRGLAAIGRALAEQLAPVRAKGGLADVDPRAKLVAAALLIVAVSLLRSLPAVGAAVAVALTAALCAGLRGRRLAPLWLGVPLFTLALALPATLNLVTPGETVWRVWRSPGLPGTLGPWTLPTEVSVTLPGLVVAARFFLRTLACVALTLALTATTEPAALVVGLRRLGLPRAFGMVLTMMQRYLVVVLRAAEDLHLAKLSRTISGESTRQGQRWAATGMGLLLLQSLRLAEGVHTAMLARGYDGDIQTLAPPRWHRREWQVAGLGAILAAMLVVADRVI
jgi:cobalt/nickel transport system permease protein